jgi:hypothetical protein
MNIRQNFDSIEIIYTIWLMLRIRAEFTSYNGLAVEAMCIFLKRFAYPCRYADLIPWFSRPELQLGMITKRIFCHMFVAVVIGSDSIVGSDSLSPALNYILFSNVELVMFCMRYSLSLGSLTHNLRSKALCKASHITPAHFYGVSVVLNITKFKFCNRRWIEVQFMYLLKFAFFFSCSVLRIRYVDS